MRVFVIIDDREERVSSIIPLLKDFISKKLVNSGIEVVYKVRRIEQGDIIILSPENAVIVELKQSRDFFSSLFDGRLFYQANKILETKVVYSQKVLKKIILIYGSLSEASIERKKNSLQLLDSAYSAIMSLTFRWGIHVFFVDNKEGLIVFLSRLIIREGMGSNQGGSPLVITHGALNLSPEVSIIANIPNIGPKKGKILLDYFGSPLRVFLDDSPHLKVKGVGAKVTESIQRYVWKDDVPVKLQDDPLVFGLFKKEAKAIKNDATKV